MIDLWVEEYILFHQYVRVRAHLRPALLAEKATIRIGPNAWELKQEYISDPVHSDYVLLSFDGLSEQDLKQEAPSIEVTLKGGEVVLIDNFSVEQHVRDPFFSLANEATEYMRNAVSSMHVLEIGSRERDGTYHSPDWVKSGMKYTGTDILSGPNVDVVCDVHELSKHVPNESFDFVYSQWGFEHFANPFVVATEINKVLRLGGEALLLSNQTIGLHDEPWDFWRFSNSAWRALFNAQTGFEILKVAQGDPMHITPRRNAPNHLDHEGSIGCKCTAIWVRKTDHKPLEWPIDPSLVAQDLSNPYPVYLKAAE